MNNLPISQQKSEETTLIFNLKASLAVAFERTSTEPYDITNMTNDVVNEFKGVDLSHLQKAIKNGSLGHYGYTYKLSTQVVCIWVREYLKNANVIYSKTNQI